MIKMKILGVEEAGRGPVIGPLVMAGVLISDEGEEKLINMGVKDSKMLTPKQREFLYDRIIQAVDVYKIVIVPAKKIDEALESANTNLNWLEADTSIDIINQINPDKAILDCPSNNIEAYASYVREGLNDKDTEIISEHKADENYVVVGAASILAKVTRDREIDRIRREIGKDFGSGYPSDPKTKEFLSKYHDKYDIFRKSWQSYKRIIKEKSQKTLGGF